MAALGPGVFYLKGAAFQTGSPGPAEMRRQIAASRQALAADCDEIRQRRQRLADAEQRLAAAVEAALARGDNNQ